MFPHRPRRGSPSLLAAEGAQLGTSLIRSDVCRSTAVDAQVVEGLIYSSTAEFASQIINPIYRFRNNKTKGPRYRLDDTP